MATYSDFVFDQSGYNRPVAGAYVYFFKNDGTFASATANPVLTDDFGKYTINDITEDVYKVQVRLGGVIIAEASVVVGTPPQYVGPPGSAGPADNTYSSYTALLASDPSRKSARLVGDTDAAPRPDGNYNYVDGSGWIAQLADGIAYSRAVNIALPLDKSLPRTLAWLSGVDPFTTASQQSKLETAFTVANAEGYRVVGAAEANYRHDGTLPLGSARFDGQSCTFTPLSNGPQALVLTGVGGVIENVTSLGAATTRNGGDDSYNGVYVVDAERFRLQNVDVGSVDPIDSASGRGHGLAAILMRRAFDGRIIDCRGYRSKADGLHFTDGSSRNIAIAVEMREAGDDTFAIVPYVPQASICTDNRIISPISYNSGSRGIALVGGARNIVESPIIIGSAAASAYINSEDSFNTTGNLDCHILNMTAYGAVQGAPHLGPNFQNAAAIIGGRAGSDTISGEIYQRAAVNCSITGSIHRAGPRCSAAIDVSAQFAIRPRIDLDTRDMVGDSSPSGILLGGVDPDVRLHADNLGGLPVLVTASTAGTAKVGISGNAMRVQGAGPDSVIFTFGAPGLVSATISGTVSNAPGTWLNDFGNNGDKIRWRDAIHNGLVKTGRDYSTAEITYTNGLNRSGGNPIILRRMPSGDVAFSGGAVVEATIPANTIIGTVPVGYRPIAPAFAFAKSGTALALIRFDTNGNIVNEDALAASFGITTGWIGI